MEVKRILIGYKRFVSKAGKDTCIAHVASEYVDVPGAVGQHVRDVFMPEDMLDFLQPEYIGKEFIPTYVLNSYGYPEIVNVTFK